MVEELECSLKLVDNDEDWMISHWIMHGMSFRQYWSIVVVDVETEVGIEMRQDTAAALTIDLVQSIRRLLATLQDTRFHFELPKKSQVLASSMRER